MTDSDICELESLWDFFSVPRAMTNRNRELLARLKQLVTIKLQEEIKNS